ncbi:retrovirus-related pol polyprotein from transposon TNT 1-94 [Tanacetum coccineum]
MSTKQDIYAAGSETRPPMLNKENYVPWSRLLCYAKSRPNGKLIYNSIINGPYVRRMIREPGSDIGIQEKKAKLFNEWERFTSTDGESIESYYHRFSKLMNDFKRNKHFPEKIASNLKFLNNLQPEWSRHVTIVHQTKDLHTTDYTQLYDFLKYNQKEVDDQRAERLAKTHDPLALMANSNNPFNYPVFHQDQPSPSTYMQQPQPINNNYNPQPSFNQNYMQQPMPNPEDITDPTTAMNMALALMAKAFKLNYSTPTNNNQRISSNPRNRQIAQPGMNMGQERQMRMVGANGGNQFRQYAGQNIGYQNGYNAVQNVGNQVVQDAVQNQGVQNVGNQNGQIVVPGITNQNPNGNGNVVAARAEGNATGNNGNQIRCYNCRGLGHLARNCTVRPRRRDAAYLQTQLLIAQKEEAGIQLQAEEFDLMAAAADLDEIEEVNANCILMANLQQASTSGTQTDKAPVYDSDGSAEVHNYDNCYDNEIFNMFTQEEQYTELLEPIPEPHQVQQNDSNVISDFSSVEQEGGTVDQHPATVEETRAYFESLYNNLALEVEKVNSVNQKMKETNADLTTELARYKNQEKCFEISQEKYDKLERCYQKSVYQEQCLTKKINALHLSSGKQITTLNEEISNLSKQLSTEKSTVSSLLEEKKKLKSDFKIREDELLDKQIQLENKIKELDNILVKTGQSIQTMHMLSPKPDSFYHTEQKMALGYQNPFYLKQAQRKQQSLYNGKVLLEKHDPPVVHDSEETLQLAQESRQKMKQLNKEIKPANYTKINHLSGIFVSQTAKSEQCLTKKINALHLSSGKQITTLNEEISNLSKQLSTEKSTVSSLLEEKKKLKSDFKIREDELLDKQIQLENKIKELDNILVKTGQSIQTMHMLSPKPDSFYHTEQKMALGYQNPFYLKQAQRKHQSLYDGKVLLEKHDPPVVHDSEETMQLAQESRQKMKQLNKEIKPANYTKINLLSGIFVSQTAKSQEEVYVVNTSKTATVSKSISKPNEEFLDDTTLSVARKFLNEVKSTIVTLQRVVKHRMTLDTHNWSSSAHQEIHKILKEEIFPIINQVDSRLQNFEIQFLKEAAKFVRDFKSLAKEADESLAKHKTLELEIERLLRAVVSQDIMSIVQNPSVVDSSNLQTELDRTKERLENCIIKKENEYAKLWNDWYKKCEECKYDKISYDKAYNDMQQKIDNGLTSFPKSKGLSKIDETHALSKPVTSNSVPTPQESKVVKNDNVISPGMFRINQFKTSKEEKSVPNKPIKASARTNPTTVSQPHALTKKGVNSNSNGFVLPTLRSNNTAKTTEGHSLRAIIKE